MIWAGIVIMVFGYSLTIIYEKKMEKPKEEDTKDLVRKLNNTIPEVQEEDENTFIEQAEPEGEDYDMKKMIR